jgi:osmotically-inducible protein OsmY
MRKTLLASLVAASAAFGLAACDRPPMDDRTAAGSPAPSGDTSSPASDATITAAVNARLAQDDELSALRIDVDTSEGRVALKGTAPNESARNRATQLASAVAGVRGVDNQLEVRSGG